MKRTTIITLAMAMSIALFQPISTFAEDQPQKEKGQGKNEKTKGKPEAKSGGKAGNREQTSIQPRTSAPAGRSKGTAAHSDIVNVKPSNAALARSRGSRSVQTQTATAPVSKVSTQNSRVTNQSSRVTNNTSVTNQSSYTRTNNYGGLWVHGDTHRDWDRNGIHSWNNHRYGWYDGGWLIIDGGFRPSGYFGYGVSGRGYSGPVYSGSSMVLQVQRRLDTQGYPVGSPDGVMGPATHDGIAAYQRDYGLAVTGRINDPLLASLGLR